MKMRWPEAKFHAESASDVQKGLAPQKMGEKRTKLFSNRKFKKRDFFFRVGKSARRLFRAGSRRGEFFAREVGAAIFSSEHVETYRRVDGVSAKRLPGEGPGGSRAPPGKKLQ